MGGGASEQRVGKDGWMGDQMNAPQTVMTTRAPAVSKDVKFCGFERFNLDALGFESAA